MGGLYVAGGEFESIENLRQNYDFCNDKEIISVQCRNRETNSTEITEDLSCDLNGFKCLNRNIGGKVKISLRIFYRYIYSELIYLIN